MTCRRPRKPAAVTDRRHSLHAASAARRAAFAVRGSVLLRIAVLLVDKPGLRHQPADGDFAWKSPAIPGPCAATGAHRAAATAQEARATSITSSPGPWARIGAMLQHGGERAGAQAARPDIQERSVRRSGTVPPPMPRSPRQTGSLSASPADKNRCRRPPVKLKSVSR